MALSSCALPKKNASLTTQIERKAAVAFPALSVQGLVRYRSPSLPSYQEALALKDNPKPTGALKTKLHHLWRSPIISNEAYYAGKRPVQNVSSSLGPILRVATWNIEKSLTMPQVAQALQSPERYTQMLRESGTRPDSKKGREMLRQRDRMATADVIFLQEMDLGVSRSGYIDAARLLAKALGMNYAYAAQAVEVDPVLLGLEPYQVDKDGTKHFYPVDKARYHGVFGSAVLSRYPIVQSRVIPLTKVYDWYEGELQRADLLERGRRAGSKLAFENQIKRELKVGGRCFFRVDIAVPQAPSGIITLVNNHLEIKTTPKGRESQMREILGHIKGVRHPVIMAGDHNSAPEDVSATSFTRTIWRQVNTPSALANTTVALADLVTGTVVPLYRERGVVNALKNFQNPLAPDVPILFPNPVKPMFDRVHEHRFADGTSFDFRGTKERSINQSNHILANSNEARRMGHRTTFSVKRPIGPIGRYRLDWFFIRSGHLKAPQDTEAPYQFAPHFGETLVEFNDSLPGKFSDHRPIIVDLPFQEPSLTAKGE